MSGKQSGNEKGARKWQFNSVAVDVKLNRVKRNKNVERRANIAHYLGLLPTIVQTILNNADEILKQGKQMTQHSNIKITRQRSEVIEKKWRGGSLPGWMTSTKRRPQSALVSCRRRLLAYSKTFERRGGREFTDHQRGKK